MDKDLKGLLAVILAADPEAPLDDNARTALMYAMLALHPREHIEALWRFAESIENEFKRSFHLNRLADLTAERPIEHDLAERIARSIPEPYWRLDALRKIAEELLQRSRQFGNFGRMSEEFRDRAMHLLQEVESSMPLILQDDDRATLLYSIGLTLVGEGKLEWAEDLAATSKYCPENTEVLLRSAKARLARGQTPQGIELARTVAKLASTGSGNLTNRAWDLEDASDLLFACDGTQEAREYLDSAAKVAYASQEAHDVDGSKCLAAIAIAFARQRHWDEAQKTAQMITQPARREYALKKIAELANG